MKPPAVGVAESAQRTPHRLELFQRGWLFVAIAPGATAVTAALGLLGRPHQPNPLGDHAAMARDTSYEPAKPA